jgi:hypothetical protein
MPNNFETVINMQEAIQLRSFPAITLWNRLDGRPRTKNFDRALKAEVRDALWMLTKQWQMGEFKGDDAASPVFAKIHVDKTELYKYQPNGHAVQAFEEDIPLETKVEHRSIPLLRGKQIISLDIRLLLGRQWLKILSKDLSLKNYTESFKDAFPIELPNPVKEACEICAYPEVWQQFAAVSGRKMDGGKLLDYFTKSNTLPQYNDLPNGVTLLGLIPSKVGALNILAEKFKNWYKKLFYQPENLEENAWLPDALEYQFTCSAPIENNEEKVLIADEYYHGRLDWYNFDIANDKKALKNPEINELSLHNGKEKFTQTFIPAPLEFNGMPNTRWWTFEDRRTNFGDIKPDTTEIAKLLLIEFGLVYANDWFLIPFTLPMGSIATVKGLTVTNVFGERLWVDAAGRGENNNWNQWRMFNLSNKNSSTLASDTSLMILPTVPKIQESKPIEEVMLIRDELANMVWAIEKVVPLAHGISKSGSETATETRQFYNKFAIQNPINIAHIENDAKIRYEIMNSVPENWIPFIPVKINNDIRKIQLQRASMPRIVEGIDPVKVKPLTSLLREGLPSAYFIHEEEIPRSGIVVSQSYQRTRWRNGQVFTWLGVRKQIGRGEGNSGLKFDSINEVKNKK